MAKQEQSKQDFEESLTNDADYYKGREHLFDSYELKTSILPRNKIALIASSVAITALVIGLNDENILASILLTLLGVVTVAGILKSTEEPFVIVKRAGKSLNHKKVNTDAEKDNNDCTQLLYDYLDPTSENRLNGLWR